MTALRLRLRSAPPERLDLSRLLPETLAPMGVIEIERLPIGTTKRQLKVADVFAVSGSPGSTLVIEGSSDRLDFLGAGMTKGTIAAEGDVGVHAGWRMKGGRLEIRGNAGPYLGAAMAGGEILAGGNAGDSAGGFRPGDRYGMTGGLIFVGGSVGAQAGERMRRGTIVSRGRCGAFAGARMMGGTLWAEGGFGRGVGLSLRRGTLIGPSVEELPPTFADCGKHDLLVLRLLANYLAATLGTRAPRPVAGPVRKFAGDMAALGRGELLVWG